MVRVGVRLGLGLRAMVRTMDVVNWVGRGVGRKRRRESGGKERQGER